MNYLKLFEQQLTRIIGQEVSELIDPTLMEDKVEDVGREFQHIEDLVYIYGPTGAKRAIDRLASIAKDSSHLEIKWDGCIDPNLIIMTNNGKMRMEEVIDRHQTGESIDVLVHDLDTNIDKMVPIDLSTKKYGDKEWVEVELENGDKLNLTIDHEVYTTNRGWVEAQYLTDSDDIKELSKNNEMVPMINTSNNEVIS
jgi:hypothetical protein